MSAFKYSNRAGIPCLKSTSAVVVDTTLTASYPSYTNVPKNFSGLIALNIAQSFTATGVTTVNIVLGTQTFELMNNSTAPATATQITGSGVYLVFLDGSAGTMYLV